MAEPEEDHQPIDMMEVLPQKMAEVYASPCRIFKEEADLPGGHEELCRSFSRFGGPRSQWIAYLHRPRSAKIWNLAPEEEAVATTSIA